MDLYIVHESIRWDYINMIKYVCLYIYIRRQTQIDIDIDGYRRIYPTVRYGLLQNKNETSQNLTEAKIQRLTQ